MWSPSSLFIGTLTLSLSALGCHAQTEVCQVHTMRRTPSDARFRSCCHARRGCCFAGSWCHFGNTSERALPPPTSPPPYFIFTLKRNGGRHDTPRSASDSGIQRAETANTREPRERAFLNNRADLFLMRLLLCDPHLPRQ